MLPREVIVALAVRVLIAVCTQTFFQPDEYFQSLEPAHHLVFGYGSLTWEWLNPLPIRSILYPALNVPIYWLLKTTGLHALEFWGDWLVILGPRVLHGIFAAGTDIALCRLTSNVIGARYTPVAFFLSISSFFHALSLSRSFSNSFETTLTTVAYTYFPWRLDVYSKWDVRKCLLCVALSCAVRPTSAIIWIFLFANLLWDLRGQRAAALGVVVDAFATGSSAIALLVFLDYLYYGRITFTSVNFFVVNLSGVSLFYGGNPWHYYLSQALPIMCTTSLPFVAYGLWLNLESVDPARKKLCRATIWTLGVYSTMGHKEWRFIHPILPLFHLLAAHALVDLSPAKADNPQPAHASFSPYSLRRKYLCTLLVPIPITMYIVLLYCSGPITVLSYIRNIPSDELRGGSVGFLMPCHSTPGHAYIHRPELAGGGMWALGCEPPLDKQVLETYQDQTTVFYASPSGYLRTRFPAGVNPDFPLSPFPTSIPGAPAREVNPWIHEWPRHLVFFGALLREEGVQAMLTEKGYQEVWRGGRSWEGDGNERKGGVRVWKWKG